VSGALRLDGVRVRLGTQLVLDDFTLSVPDAACLALLGHSGSGKTTVLRTASGFVRPERGRVWLGDADVTDLPPERRRVALIHQQFLLFPHLTVERNVAFGMAYRGLSRKAQQERVGELLELFGLTGLERRYPHELSGGQQQRVAIARALAVDPDVLLLDEPLSNLDRTTRTRLLDELKQLRRRTAMTMLYVTHDWGEAEQIADSVALLDTGQIVQRGSLAELQANPATAAVAAFFGVTPPPTSTTH
jgi:2-aminoethylphosphonate transport system ATP-binding protein